MNNRNLLTITEVPVLICSDFNRLLQLQTDASENGLGAVLLQIYDGNDHILA